MATKPGSLIAPVPAVVLPEGYKGKIMLLSVSAGGQRVVVLRSGGPWHRDILSGFKAEIESLGLPGAQVREHGGAFLSVEADGSISLWGRSDEFGRCDLRRVKALVSAVWPDRQVFLPFEEGPFEDMS
jgi:hypothetical protein